MNLKKLTVSLLVVLAVSSIYCKKEEDYRDAYMGTYNFTINYHCLNFQDSLFYDSTSYYTGTISKYDDTSGIKICYTPNACMCATLSTGGALDKPPHAGLGYVFSGSFKSTKEVSFMYSTFGTKQNVTGIKN